MFYLYAHKSNIKVQARATSLIGAKREASKWMTYGGGSISVLDKNSVILATREFWEDHNRFGWERWT